MPEKHRLLEDFPVLIITPEQKDRVRTLVRYNCSDDVADLLAMLDLVE
jgi:hypothetical protein